MEVLRPDLLRTDFEAFQSRLRGRRVERLGRRGKNLVFVLDDGWRLVVNLGMTGRLLLAGAGEPSDHPGVRFGLEPGGTLVYDDVRRFGTLEILDEEAWARKDEALGPEPLSRTFRPGALEDALSASRMPVRSWLLDQGKIAGVGNIYANEALHRAGIHPAEPAGTIGPPRARALHGALREVLTEAVEARGTTLRDYRDARGESGDFGPRLRVYGRDGSPCPRCGHTLRRTVFGNRSAFFCPSCQPPVGT